MASERALWTTSRDKLKPFGRMERVENRVGKGTPDVCFALRLPSTQLVGVGWLELKQLDRWSVHERTPIIFRSLTLEQVCWHEDWCRAGGRSFFLLQVQKTYLLVSGRQGRIVYEGAAQSFLRGIALVVGEKVFPTREMLQCLVSIKI